jgi:hypothetical protein
MHALLVSNFESSGLSFQVTKDLHFSVISDACSGNPGSPIQDAGLDPEKVVDLVLPVEVKEQRLSNLLQSVLVGGCLAAMPVLRRIPTAVLWGYFAFMALEGLPGNQFWERICLLATSPNRRYK